MWWRRCSRSFRACAISPRPRPSGLSRLAAEELRDAAGAAGRQAPGRAGPRRRLRAWRARIRWPRCWPQPTRRWSWRPVGAARQLLQQWPRATWRARAADGKPLDPVARFTWATARAWSGLNWAADPRPFQTVVRPDGQPRPLKRIDKHRDLLAQAKTGVGDIGICAAPSAGRAFCS